MSIALLAWALVTPPVAAQTQQSAKVARIGFLVSTVPVADQSVLAAERTIQAFRRGLRDLGYVEGRNIVIEFRSAEGNLERFPALVAELIALHVDVIVAPPTPAALAARQATRTIPVVFIGAADPVNDGLVTSLARPGGNVTGLSVVAPELAGKRLEQLKLAVPTVSRVGVLWHPGGSGERTEKEMLQATERAAKGLGLRLQRFEASSSEGIERAFQDMTGARAGGVVVHGSVLLFNQRRRLADLALKHRLPSVYPSSFYVESGGLMSYGPDFTDSFRRAATYVDRLLKGAKAGDLPVEQPTKFELVINLKTAKMMGLTIPQSVLQRADHVVE